MPGRSPEIMPFRWPSIVQDISLATEVAARNPSKPSDWEEIANILSTGFSTDDKPVRLTGRACRERFERLIQKFKDEDQKSLKRSGTEEEYSHLNQLLEDIYIFRRDMEEQTKKEKEAKKKKESEDKKIGEEMRAAALTGMGKRKDRACESEEESAEDDDDDDDDDETTPDTKRKTPKKRATRLSALELLERKSENKVAFKEKELEQRKLELDFQKEKYREEAEERKERLKLELEERRMFLSLLKDKL